jgi:2'-hydroxyisoflavone reductase
MRILIVGGTIFVGRALTEAALKRGHTVTLLNRGTNLEAIPAGVEHLKADRDKDLGVLAGRTWDAVIDTCAYLPRQVRALLNVLEGQPHYTLISSVAAHADFSRPGYDEASPLCDPPSDESIEFDWKHYGPLKVGCEQVANQLAGGRCLIIRPGIIVGPYDPTGRFGYWLRRIIAGEEFIAPDDLMSLLQVIDVRDLAGWMVRLVEQRAADAYIAVGPQEPLKFHEFLLTALAVLNNHAKPIWVPSPVLKIVEGSKTLGEPDYPILLPLWVPGVLQKNAGMFGANGNKAWSAGLELRPLTETIADAGAYEAKVATPRLLGLSPTEEREELVRLKALMG